METPKAKFPTIDAYIASFPSDQRAVLEEMRSIIREAVPEAKEIISYGMPAFKTEEILVYFARAKNHIGFYPTPSAITAFRDELSEYTSAKGSVQFPIDEPMPQKLISKMTRFRTAESKEKAALKKKK